MTTERQRKIIYRTNVRSYLQKLSCFIRQPVKEADLLSLDETMILRTTSKEQFSKEAYVFTIPFEEKTSERFQSYISRLQSANPSGVYIWIDQTIDCGTTAIKSLSEFNWNFAFNCDSDGILALTATNLEDKILLDYSEDSPGEKVLEVKVTGKNWPRIRYRDE